MQPRWVGDIQLDLWSPHRMHPRIVLVALLPLLCSGCAVVRGRCSSHVVATTVKVGANVVETAVDVTAAGVKAVVGSDEDEE